MLTPSQPMVDCQGPVHARFSKRRERRPGTRERHSIQHLRQSQEIQTEAPSTPRSTFVGHAHTGGFSERYTLRPNSNRTQHQIKPNILSKNEDVLETQVTSHYQELTTIENIRKQLAAQPRPQTTPPTLPDWLLNLDLNLDVTTVDIIPPFESAKQEKQNTYLSRAKVTIIHEDNYNGDGERDGADNGSERYDSHSTNEDETDYNVADDRQAFSRLSNYSTHEKATTGPRRYQGDMRVMSLQKGGIRSTPFQPKAKKFINQMITYHHMKVHNKKLKTVKPAVDAKMPSTFHMALDRKKLVEERLNESWNASYHSSTPRRTTTPSSYRSSSKDKTERVSS